jgi:hypothetical protein
MNESHNGLDARAVQVTVTATGGANAAVVATMPAVPGWVNVIQGYDITGTGATAAALVDITISNLGVAVSHKAVVPAGVTALCERSVRFPNGLRATGANLPIAVTLPALGLGSLAATVNVYGYRVKG